ncbi:non-heme iron oxygenase ferredoxin subunit [Pseudorhodoplanes sp.]|uniref:non-heme iron oxygenase ferredoxin subunit n=1 Tax=Pseudorhodoplanes sp. TaxID=1934341 RepID=UPI003D14C660
MGLEKKPNQSVGGSWVRVASIDEIPAAGVRAVEVNGHELALYNIAGSIFCTSNICTHAYALLSDGFLEGTEIECPLHAGRFDVLTGKALCSPVTENLVVYETKVSGTDVLVLLYAR